MKQKATPNLKDAKAETMVALPSLITYGTQEMFTFLEVKGAATDASASDKDIPDNRMKDSAVILFLSPNLHVQFLRPHSRYNRLHT